MDKLSKKDLIELVTSQQSELKRYQTRFKDLVAAHKGLLVEKELLEQSLKSVTKISSKSSENSDPEASSEDTGFKEEPDNEDSPDHLRNQISTLMNSLATLSEEKSRMEAAFQADKKQLRTDKIQAESKIKELESRLEHETRAHLNEMENFKAKLILERHQREKEHNDHGVMIRELQKVMYEERSKKEKVETTIENLNSELAKAQKAIQESSIEAAEAKQQLDAIKEKLKSNKPNNGASAEKLQQQLEQLKRQHIENSIAEREKYKEAEEKSKRQTAVQEERVANLEARLAELSQTVGLYDRLRQSDQIAIEKLKERISQLEVEKGDEKTDSPVGDDIAYSVKKLKQLIQNVTHESEKQIDIKSIFNDILGDLINSDDLHKICKEDYDILKTDFDLYKKQVQLPQRPLSPSNDFSNKQQEFKSQIKALKDRISSLHQQLDDMEKLHKKEKDDLHQALLNEKVKYQAKLHNSESEWKSKVEYLETQLAKQRERALSLVNEKEQDISDLRESLNTLIPKHINTEKATEGDGVVLHYSEELARRDVELARLRKEKHQIEFDLREVRREMSQLASHEQHLSLLLHQQLQRFEQCQSREGANLEYLKNVVFNFLLTSDSNSKRHMLNAIAAVLKFSDAEKSKITQLSWWYKS